MPPLRSKGAGRPLSAVPHERRRDPERSRERLLSAALEEFSAKGFAGARVQEIAARAGLNAQLIAYYFDSKEGLYRALQQRWLEREAAFTDPALPIEEVVAGYLHLSLADPRVPRLLLWAGLGDGAPSQEEAVVQANAQADITALRRRQERGELADDLDPAMLQIAIIGAVLAPVALPHVVRRLTGLDPADPEFEAAYTEQMKVFVQRLGAPQVGLSGRANKGSKGDSGGVSKRGRTIPRTARADASPKPTKTK